jgi:prophage antirepressor-like protein
MEQENVQVFDFESREVRIFTNDDEFEFVAKDIVEGVGAIWNGKRAIAHVPNEWKVVRFNLTTSGERETWFLKEQGVYFYLARSNKPAALPFQKKIAGEIMPSIRKHGAYITQQKIDETPHPDPLPALAQALKNERDKVKELEAQVEAAPGKIIFADSLMDIITSQDTVLIGEFVKIQKERDFLLVWLDEHASHVYGWTSCRDWIQEGNIMVRVPNESETLMSKILSQAELHRVQQGKQAFF